jgi:hypothetical protein
VKRWNVRHVEKLVFSDIGIVSADGYEGEHLDLVECSIEIIRIGDELIPARSGQWRNDPEFARHQNGHAFE